MQFIRERIEIHVQDNNCCLKGQYYFTNNTSTILQRTVYYPFIVSEALPFPDSIVVNDMGNCKTLPFLKSRSGILFSISIPPKTTNMYEVMYFQRTLDYFMEYILTTTHQWGKPLMRGEYVVDIPSKYKLKYISMRYDREEDHDGDISYIIHRENFMPEKNLIIRWERSTQ
ncbi:MAG: hypothetical protein HY800_04630 [Ignavibacteriales bacterium]|nr:hypothetical protein [Ignavibacteriales bacterium]